MSQEKRTLQYLRLIVIYMLVYRIRPVFVRTFGCAAFTVVHSTRWDTEPR